MDIISNTFLGIFKPYVPQLQAEIDQSRFYP
jgi:hypothetical protein